MLKNITWALKQSIPKIKLKDLSNEKSSEVLDVLDVLNSIYCHCNILVQK